MFGLAGVPTFDRPRIGKGKRKTKHKTTLSPTETSTSLLPSLSRPSLSPSLSPPDVRPLSPRTADSCSTSSLELLEPPSIAKRTRLQWANKDAPAVCPTPKKRRRRSVHPCPPPPPTRTCSRVGPAYQVTSLPSPRTDLLVAVHREEEKKGTPLHGGEEEDLKGEKEHKEKEAELKLVLRRVSLGSWSVKSSRRSPIPPPAGAAGCSVLDGVPVSHAESADQCLTTRSLGILNRLMYDPLFEHLNWQKGFEGEAEDAVIVPPPLTRRLLKSLLTSCPR